MRPYSIFTLLIVAAVLTVATTFAAESKPHVTQRLLDRTPFDQVVLNQANEGKVLEVLPLTLPRRPLTTLPTTGTLKVRLLNRPTEDFEVAWSNVAQVRVFEQVLLNEAQRLAAAGKFDDAYDYYARLEAEFPTFPGLNDAICDYLRQNALALFQAKQNDRALALLLTLYQRNPSYTALPPALEAVAGEIIQKYLRDGNFAAARRVLELWQNQFPNIASPAAAAWQGRFQTAAAREVADANNQLAQKQYIRARKAVGRALAIWPNLDAAKQIMTRIEREYPYISVGVLETAPHTPSHRIDDWAALRSSALTTRLLAEETDFGAEGGTYRSPFGEWNIDETGRELSLKLAPTSAGATSDAIARYLISVITPGNPNFRTDLASLLAGVSIKSGNSIELYLNRVHVRPESLLQLPLPANETATPTNESAAPFKIADFTPDQVVYSATNAASSDAGRPQAIVEQTLANAEAAFAALTDGEVDVLDRVPPWQLERLRGVQDIHISNYKLPTVHVLIPNLQKPLLAKREFRRALCYGIDRKWIVDRVLLGGHSLPGFEPLSGPFPIGSSPNDPIRYGHNNQIAPRPFEPRLASILATVAWSSVQNPPEKTKAKSSPGEPEANSPKKRVDTNIPELILAYPSDAVARVACQSIQVQLAREGIPTKLREFTADELLAGKVEYDLRYAELAVWEPVSDARLILGPGSLTAD
ncbi:MAG TPA: ABC transporter substrate-binding protein, partial [Lacipirellulaceae bacterium]|nr:ABC transporter substrate-binding protein [Lacipirellulaceae bacterium]